MVLNGTKEVNIYQEEKNKSWKGDNLYPVWFQDVDNLIFDGSVWYQWVNNRRPSLI